MAYWYDGAALAATRSPVIALFWCLIKFTTTTTTTIHGYVCSIYGHVSFICVSCFYFHHCASSVSSSNFFHCLIYILYVFQEFIILNHYNIL